jgi:hypothetical protein
VQWVDVTPEEELRILVVDNRTTRIGQDDTTKITDILAELANTPIGLDGTGYGAADLDALIDGLAGATSDLNADEQYINETFSILIECNDENQQTNILDRLTEEGLKCRALIS